MRALILPPEAIDDAGRGPAAAVDVGERIDDLLHALAASGFREIVIGAGGADPGPFDTLGDGDRWGVRLHRAPAGDGGSDSRTDIAATLPLLGSSPFALVVAGIRTDYPLGRLRAVKCDWAHLVLVPGVGAATEAGFALQGARVVDRPGTPADLRFGGIAVCHPRLFPETAGSLLSRLRSAAGDHLVTGEVYHGAWDDARAAG